jgi:hypothetical protein
MELHLRHHAPHSRSATDWRNRSASGSCVFFAFREPVRCWAMSWPKPRRSSHSRPESGRRRRRAIPGNRPGGRR